MAVRKASAVWEGDLPKGSGSMRLGSGAFEGKYSFASRFEEGPGTNPEELIGAAHAGCFSMALAHGLAQAGHPARRISTEATVHLEKKEDGFAITRILLRTRGEVPGIERAAWQEQAEQAKQGCPVSKALAGVRIELEAELIES